MIAIFGAAIVQAQEVLPLYAGNVPGSKNCDTKEQVHEQNGQVRISQVTMPTLTVYLPDPSKSKHVAVIICPGGGYARLAMTHEGYDVAKRFQEQGIAAFVLKYRLPNDACMADRKYGPLQDVQEAIRMVRKKAAEWQIDPSKVGVMGFSAGGHLASSAGTHFSKPVLAGEISVRPDFQMLIYPVISMKNDITHAGSKANLVGKDAAEDMVNLFSNELQVMDNTPPCFLVHAADDGAVPAANSISFAQAAMAHKVPVEMHLYPKGGHGFGMVNKTTAADWFAEGLEWLKSIGML